MILQLVHPWLGWKVLLGGLTLFVDWIWYVHDALFAAKELDSVLSNQLPMVYLQAINLLS